MFDEPITILTPDSLHAACVEAWRIYHDELGRPPDPYCSGLLFALATGAITNEDARANVRASSEWARRHQPPVPAPPPLAGRVRLDGRAMADDGGPYLALGASLFWAVRGARSEPDRLAENLRWLKARGVDFVRVLADTTDWSDETRTDPRWPDYATALRRCRDLCADAGLRVAWTIFGGNQLTADERRACASTLGFVCAERPATVQYVEITNEGNGHLTADEYRQYAAQIRDGGFVVALTSIGHGAQGLYDGSAANVATVHFDRIVSEDGWRPVRQPWGYPGEYATFSTSLPAAFINNEPIGPGSSVASDTDPERLAMGAVHTWICGGCAHVVHFGAGIYGVQTSHPVGGNRPPNVWEQDALEDTLARIAEYRRSLPADLPNWTRTRHGRADHPYTFPPDPLVTVGDGALSRKLGCVRAYGAYQGDRFVVAVIGIMDRCVLRPQHTNGGELDLTEDVGRSRLLTGRYL